MLFQFLHFVRHVVIFFIIYVIFTKYRIILGGGIVKHHNCNANMMRNGADYAVYINTGHEFDGSDAGASPDEAVSWGKIRVEANPVKLSCDASLIFPLIVSQTFYKAYQASLAADVLPVPPVTENEKVSNGTAEPVSVEERKSSP